MGRSWQAAGCESGAPCKAIARPAGAISVGANCFKMVMYLMQRLILMTFTIILVSIIVFFLVHLKGDSVDVSGPPYCNETQRYVLRRVWVSISRRIRSPSFF